jgi:hypothetical protein
MFEMNREQILVALEKLATEFQSDGGVTLRLVGGATHMACVSTVVADVEKRA